MNRQQLHYQSVMAKLLPVFVVVAGLCSLSAFAEVIHIPVGQQAPALRELPRPVRGMSANSVLDTFGEPNEMTAPVGQPPISKWSYDNYTVYFESSVVIHSVLTHRPTHPIE